jgi:GTP 3',8-cyclase
MLRDRYGRTIEYLRLSVTDRCDLRCTYCMPTGFKGFEEPEDWLTFDEIERLLRAFARLGTRRIRLTGGEPLLRRDLPELIRIIARKPEIRDLALTTNGVMLAEHARTLHRAGLHRLTVSLDTLRPDRFQALTRFDSHSQVLAGVEEAINYFEVIKLDAVIIRGTNDDELIPLLEYARRIGAELRFIEYMDVGGATQWSPERVFSRGDMLQAVEASCGAVTPILDGSWAPADRFALPDGTTFGIISSTTAPFCRTCDRSRLTADGLWFRCLYAREGTDLRALLRSGASDEVIADVIATVWSLREDRGAELRAAERERTPFIPVSRLRRDPHLEMHTRGG